MKHIIFNEDNLKQEDITEVVTRTKILLIDNDTILVGYSNNQYQFIGGHVEESEDLVDCLTREVKEETGIELDIKDIKPFLKTEQYCKNHPSIGKNRNVTIYYYVINASLEPNLSKTNYTKEEQEYHFEIEKIKLSEFENLIKSNYSVYPNAIGIGKEMINTMNIYHNIYNNIEIRDLYTVNRIKTGYVIKKNDVVPFNLFYITCAIFIVNSKNEFLIQKRSVKKDSTYAITGGHPVSGVSSLDGIVEEVKEEIGITLDKNKIELIKTIQTYDDFFDIYVTKEEIDLKDIKLQVEEVEQVMWLSYDEIKQIINENKFNKGHLDLFQEYFNYEKSI